MQVRRSFAHEPEGGWSSVALHLAPAEIGKDGFYLTLFPDGRPPAVVFLSQRQVGQLIEMAQESITSDQALWDFVAKIPLEPLLPSRTLAGRLRALLVDCASGIRAQVRAQLERRPAAPAVEASEEPVVEPEELPPKPWQLP